MSEANKQVLDTRIGDFLGILNNAGSQVSDPTALHLVWSNCLKQEKENVVNGLRTFVELGKLPSDVDEVFPRKLLNASPDLRFIKRTMFSF